MDLKQLENKILEEYYKLTNKYYIVFDDQVEKIPNMIKEVFKSAPRTKR